MATPAELLHANLHEIFGERDPARRRAAIEKTYATDVTFRDPEGVHTGCNEVDKAAEGLLGRAPADLTFAESGPSYIGADAAALAWTFGPVGHPVARGIDLLTIRDGRVAAITTLLEGQ